jgi:hypothetical protein
LGQRRQSSQPLSASRTSAVQEISPVAYRVLPGESGWVSVAVPYQKGWSLNGREARPSFEGTLLVWAPAQGGVLRFTPWGMVRLGYLMSAGVFLAVIIALVRKSTRYSKPTMILP